MLAKESHLGGLRRARREARARRPQGREVARPVSRRGGQGWFLAFGGFQHHVKFSFFKGTSFKPVPPIGQFKDVRSLDVRESDKIDEKQLATWIKQAASIPGWDSGSTRYGGSTVRARSGSDFLYYVKGTLEGNHGEVRWNP